MADLEASWEQLNEADFERRIEAGKALVAGGADLEKVLPAMIEVVRLTPPEPYDLWPYYDYPYFLSYAFFDCSKPAVRALAVTALNKKIPVKQRINLVRFITTFHRDVEIANPFLQQIVESRVDAKLRAWAEVVLNKRHNKGFEITKNVVSLASRDDIEMPLRVKALDCLRRAKASAKQKQRFKEISLAAVGSEHEQVVEIAGINLSEYELEGNDWKQVYAALDGGSGHCMLKPLQNQPHPPAKLVPTIMQWLDRSWEPDNEYAQTLLARIGQAAIGPCLKLAGRKKASHNSRSGALWTLWRMESLDKKSAGALRKLLTQPYPISSLAAAVLAHFGDHSAETLTCMMHAFEDNDSSPHCNLAKKVIRQLPADTVVPFMISKYQQLVGDEEFEKAADLMHFFMHVGSNSEAACRFIAERLRTATGYYDGNMVNNAVSSVAYPLVPLLVESLSTAAVSGDDEQVIRVLEGMAGRIFHDPDVKQFIEPVTPFLKSKNNEVVAAAEELLSYFSGTPAHRKKSKAKQQEKRKDVAAARKQLKKMVLTEAQAKEETILQLQTVNDRTSQAIDYHLRCLRKRIASHRALNALKAMGEEAYPEIVAKLSRMLEGPYQLDVLPAIAEFVPAASAASQKIASLLGSGEPAVLIAALNTLAEVGSTKPACCKRVLELASHADSEVATAALKALGGCQSRAGNALLIEAAKTYDESYRLVSAVAKIRPFPEEGYAIFEKEIESDDGVQHMVHTAIFNLGEHAQRLLPKLIEALPQHHACRSCDDFGETTKSIALFGKAAISAIPEIEKYLRGRQHYNAAEAVWRIAPSRAKELNLPDIYIRERQWWT